MNNWSQFTKQITQGKTLSREAVSWAASGLLDGDESALDKKEFLRAMTLRGVRAEEIVAFVEEFLAVARDPQVKEAEFTQPLLDVVGTGGDRLNLFNVSTTTLFVATGAGALGVKHGNRSISSQSGGADVLEELGVELSLAPEEFSTCLREAGCGFLFAPIYHPGFAQVGAIRKELAAQGVSTMFNLLGPLLNPARVEQMLVGVAKPEWLPLYADIFTRLSRRRILLVCGQSERGEWMDEGSVSGPTRCILLEDGKQSAFILEAGEYGCKAESLEQLRGGNAQQNAQILRDLLSGKERGPRREMLVFNSALALRSSGLAPTIERGVSLANETLDSGKALQAMERFVAWHKVHS